MLNLSKLAHVAKDTSAAGRNKLVSLVTDMFLDAKDDPGEQISLLFGDIVMKVLGQLEQETRMVLAKRVCLEGRAPHDLMVRLAKDEFAVASPVLHGSPVLTSDDLADIATTASMAHLGAIAGRPAVDENVTAVLVDRGDRAVLTKVTENTGARFADDSFMKLVFKARNDQTIQAALINRADLPEEAGRMLLPMLTEELMERVSALGADNTLVQLMAERAAVEVAARAQKIDKAREQSNALIKDVVGGKVKIDEAVTMFARADRTAELGILLAKVSDLPPAAVSQLLFGASDKPLVILCKANNVGAAAYKDVLTMRARRLQHGGLELNAAIQRYDAMSPRDAVQSLEALRQSAYKSFGVPETADKSEAKPARKEVPFAAHR